MYFTSLDNVKKILGFSPNNIEMQNMYMVKHFVFHIPKQNEY